MHDNRDFSGEAVEPGQIWLVEQNSAAGLCRLDRSAVTSANVVLYERALAPLVAEILPLGSYAEPLPRDAAAISPRALAFARDGWSVVQLVEPCAGRRARLRAAAWAMFPVAGADDLSVRVIAKTVSGAEGGRPRDGCLPRLAELIDELDEDDPLTLVFGPLAARASPAGRVFTANGLAG